MPQIDRVHANGVERMRATGRKLVVLMGAGAVATIPLMYLRPSIGIALAGVAFALGVVFALGPYRFSGAETLANVQAWRRPMMAAILTWAVSLVLSLSGGLDLIETLIAIVFMWGGYSMLEAILAARAMLITPPAR